MAGKRNIEIIRGDDYSHVVTLSTRVGGVVSPINITGRVYTAQLRLAKSQAVPDASFGCTITNAAAGEVTLVLAHGVTAAIPPETYYWDLQQDAGGIVNTILSGRAEVITDVTR